VICFIHIERAGGSTMHNMLNYYIPGYVSLKPWYYWTNDTGNYLTQKELKSLQYFHPFLKGFGGHTTRHYLNYGDILRKDIKYFTFLREPISRYLSHFQFQRDKMNINRSLEAYIDEKKFNNYMTIRLAKIEDAEKAINELDSKFIFVGIVEQYNESLLRLRNTLNWSFNPLYEKINEGNSKSSICFEGLPLNMQRKIIDNNSQDIILYNEYLKKFNQNSHFKNKPSLQELDVFEKNLNSYQYNAVKRRFLRMKKGYNHFVSEPLSHLLR